MGSDLLRLDAAVYQAVADTPTPQLDEPMRRLSDLANRSKLWIILAMVIALVGGRRGRRAALIGVAALGVNAVVVNIVVKLGVNRPRPDRDTTRVPPERHVAMPTSSSFPSGHTASGFAFATAVAGSAPGAAAPLRALAALVGYSRVHTGVHYPLDVLAGALIGTTTGQVVAAAARALDRRSLL
jgi:membrane-associated phospholipid phosphatase